MVEGRSSGDVSARGLIRITLERCSGAVNRDSILMPHARQAPSIHVSSGEGLVSSVCHGHATRTRSRISRSKRVRQHGYKGRGVETRG